MYDLETIKAAGIDPKTGLPIKLGAVCGCALKDGIKARFERLDEQNAINCFTWYNLPSGISPQLLERILYYRGQGMFFYIEEIDKFFFLPYTLVARKGTGIDIYGRYISAKPLPFNGSSYADENDTDHFITNYVRDCVYDVELPEDYIEDDGSVNVEKILETQNSKCVLLHDYTQSISEKVQSNAVLNQPLLEVMSEMVPFARTALLNGTGIQGMRVSDESEAQQVAWASDAINNAALNGRKWVAMQGSIEFQDFTNGPIAKAEEYFLALQSLDNLRLSFYGLDNGGLFQKKSHMLAAEQEVNQGNVGLVLQDRLRNRQNFCTLVNSIWGLDMWCAPSETALGMDRDGDMVAGDNEEKGTNMGGTPNKEDSSNDM